MDVERPSHLVVSVELESLYARLAFKNLLDLVGAGGDEVLVDCEAFLLISFADFDSDDASSEATCLVSDAYFGFTAIATYSMDSSTTMRASDSVVFSGTECKGQKKRVPPEKRVPPPKPLA